MRSRVQDIRVRVAARDTLYLLNKTRKYRIESNRLIDICEVIKMKNDTLKGVLQSKTLLMPR